MKSLIVLSGGLDSLVALAKSIRETELVETMTFDYGQRAGEMELRAARAISEFYSVPWRSFELPWLKEMTKTALVNRDRDVPEVLASDLDRGAEFAEDTAREVWVPNRNGVFLAIAGAIAESKNIDQIVTGFNAEEAETFPDNSLAFVDATNRAFQLSTLSHPKVVSPLGNLDKVGIVRLGLELNVPFHLMYSCYMGAPEPCGKCESCARMRRAFDEAGVATKGTR